jgi:DHA1 family bicyclomycin/chloramphenicol resistance-like MFS transporter
MLENLAWKYSRVTRQGNRQNVQLKTKVLYLASLVAFMRSFSQVIYVPSQMDILQDLGTTTAFFGLTLSVFALTFAAGQLFLGPVVDRYDSKLILIVGMLIFTTGSLGGIFVQSIEALFLIRVLQALGIAAAVIVGIALISDDVPGSERGKAMGTFEIWSAAGAAAGPILGAFLAIWLSWRIDFLLLGLLGICLAIFSYWQLPQQSVRTEKVGLREMSTILRNPATFGSSILGFVQFYALFTVFTLLPLMLSTQLGMGTGSIGILVSLLPIGALIGSLVGGRASDRINIRTVLIPGSLLAAFAFSMLTLISRTADQSTPIAVIVGAVIISGFAVGVILPGQLKIMVDYFPSMRGTASGLAFSFRFIGATLSPFVAGYLAETYSLSAGFGSAAILLAIGAVISILTIKEPTIISTEVGLDTDNPTEIR